VLLRALLGPDAVRQAIVVAVVSDVGREERIQLEQFLEVAIEKRAELRVGSRDRTAVGGVCAAGGAGDSVTQPASRPAAVKRMVARGIELPGLD
jgi:hypothetical protein